MKVQAIFENIQQSIELELNQANNLIRVALAYFNDEFLFDILCKKASQGLKIELIISSEDVNYVNGVLDYLTLIKSGGTCMFTNSTAHGLMHHKFCIVDDCTIITGSYNWTNKAALSNFENVLILKDANDIVQDYNNEFIKLKKFTQPNLNLISSLTSVNELLNDHINNSLKDNMCTSLSTDIPSLDNLIDGFKTSGVYAIASHLTWETSSLGLNIIHNTIKKNKSVALYSMEFSASHVLNRLIALFCDIPVEQVTTNSISTKDRAKLEALSSKDLFIDDSSELTIKGLEYSLYKHLTNRKLDLVVIENIELLKIEKNYESINRSHRDYELEYITRELKRISRIIKVPILITSHLNRFSEIKSPIRVATLSEMPTYLEEYVDVLIYINRPEKYGFMEDEEGNSMKGKVRLYVLKNKFGSVGDEIIMFDDQTMKYKEFETSENTTQPISFSTRMGTSSDSNTRFDTPPF
jgi:replicative DNA helicase